MSVALRCPVTSAYLEGFSGVQLAPPWKDPTLARPLFRPQVELDSLARDARQVLRLIEEIPHRMFGGSLGDYLEAQGRPPEAIDAILRGSVGHTTAYGRLDTLDSPMGLRVIEINVGSDVGGLDYGGIGRHMLADPAFRRFADSHGLHHIDPAHALISALRRTSAEVVGVDDPRVALIEENNADRNCQPLADVLRAAGLDVLLGELGDLSFRGDKVLVRNRPIDVVLRYFFVEHLLAEPGALDLLDRLVAAHLNGRTAFFTSLDLCLHESKSVLALLYSDPMWRGLTEPERALVSRLIPPTRFMSASDLPRSTRRNLIAKPAFGRSGMGVRFGSAVDDQAWNGLLRSSTPYVVQEVVDAVPEQMSGPETAGITSWIANWGVFFTDDSYGGCFIRAIPAGDPGVIASTNPAKRNGVVFTY